MVAIGVKYVLLAALLAQASGSAPVEDKAKARALLQDGLAFNRQGQHAKALEKFQDAYAAYPSPKLWFNIGQVQVALDHPVEAAEAFDKFLALVPDARPEDRKDARSALAQLANKLGRLQIKCETEGADAAVDGRSVGRVPLPSPLWSVPGSHRVAITHEGFAPATETVEIGAGTTALVVIRLVALSPPTPVAAHVPSPAVPAQQTAPAPEVPVANPPVPSPTAAAPTALDLSTQRVPAAEVSQAKPFYKTWWFWTGAGLAVAGGVTTAILLTRPSGSNVPTTDLGNHGVFQ